MGWNLKHIFTRRTPTNPRAEQQAQRLAFMAAHTIDSPSYSRMEHADINALLAAAHPGHPPGHTGPKPLPPGSKTCQHWLRAQPESMPETGEALYRVYLHISPGEKDDKNTHIVRISTGCMNRAAVNRLFTLWNEEAARIAARNPEPEKKYPPAP